DDITNGFLDIFSRMFLWVATLFLKLSVFVLSFIIEIGGYNGFVVSGAVTIGWVIVRDISNMFFVVALLVIAFGTILGLENYEWKKMLGKLFLAALLVNFSRTICGLIIDAAQVVMITFINGVAATAGGNLINAFKLDKILKLSTDYSPGSAAGVAADGNMFMAAVAGLVFSSLVIAILLVFLYILVVRMIVLWVLIVLSPLAFALTALPRTKSKYFDEWWKEFSANVIIGPMLAFFLWLSFAVVGAGDVHDHVRATSDVPDASLLPVNGSSEADKIGSSAGITQAMTWDSMANFFIAIGMLWVGAEKAKNLGAAGAGALGGAQNFAKGIGKMATGVSAGMWAGKKGKELGIKGAKAIGGAMASPFTDRAKMVKARIQAARAKSNIPILGSKGRLKREGALAEMKKSVDAAEGAAREQGKMTSYIGAGNVTQNLAENEINKEIVERRAKAESDEMKGKITIAMTKKGAEGIDRNYQKNIASFMEKKEKEAKKSGIGNEYYDKDGKRTDKELSKDIKDGLYLDATKTYSKQRGGDALAQSFAESGEAGKVSGKAATESKRMEYGVIDRIRQYEGKESSKMDEFEAEQLADDKTKMDRKDYSGRMAILKDSYESIRSARERLNDPDAKFEKGEKEHLETVMKNKGRSMAVVMASIAQNGESHLIPGTIDRDLGDIDASDPTQNHKLDLALLTGRTAAEINAKDKQPGDLNQVFEEEVRGKMFKEKQGELMRGLMNAKNAASSEKGENHQASQLMVGKDVNGDDKITFSSFMKKGMVGGTDGSIATGDAKKSGHDKRAGTQEYNLGFSRLSKMSASTLVSHRRTEVTDSNGKKMEIASKYSDRAIGKLGELASMSTSEIKSMGRDVINTLSGGDDMKSSFDGAKFNVTAAFGTEFEKMLMNFQANIMQPPGAMKQGDPGWKTSNTIDNNKKVFTTLMTEMGLEAQKAQEVMQAVIDGKLNTFIKTHKKK
ncbi:hypothetical protein KKA14_11580, partial [bacterium]|nr:hypothetical protein [bacterium]